MSLEFEQQITLDLTVQKVQNVHCSEDDKNSRNIAIQLTDKGKPYNVSDEKLYFKLTKPDGNFVYIDEDDTEHLHKENGKIIIILSDQATAVGGICKAEIQLKKDGKIITTINFHVIVKKSVLSDDTIVSDIESNVLDKLTNHLDNDSIHVTPDKRTLWNTVVDKLDKTGDASNVINTFSTASTRTNLTTGEKLSVSLSKISKWFRDLKSIAFSGSYNDLSDKPTLGTASAKDVASTGNASASQVVMGNDTRLSDARKASDVSAWAKASTKPTYTASEVGAYTKTEIDTKLNGKANSSHTHGNGDITSLDASKITSGIINIDRLPQGALERLTVVADDTARFKLTSSNIQKGDTVKVTSTGKMYYVVDETQLSSEAGYEVYAAGTAASVPWSGVTGKPSTYAPSSHTHTKSQITDFPTSMPANGGNSATVNGHTVKSDVPANAKFTDTTYSDATTTSSGLMSASDKTTIENLKNGAVTGIKGNAEKEYRTGNVNITAEDIGMNVDSALSSTSTNPVQNKVVAAALDGKMPVYSYNGGTFDADDLTSPAIHLINSGGTNLPASCSGGVLLVDGSPQTTQYFFPLYNGDNRIHTRYKYHGTEWTDWKILGLSTSQSTAITTTGTYALDAVQNNASVSGTLANKINPVTSALILATGFNKESGQLFKINKTVTLNGRYTRTTNFTQSDFTTIGTLPSGFRPTTNIYSPATVCNTTTVYPAIVRILTTGKVQVYTNNLGQYLELCVTFLV